MLSEAPAGLSERLGEAAQPAEGHVLLLQVAVPLLCARARALHWSVA